MRRDYCHTLPQIIEKGAQERPEHIAFVCAKQSLSFAELRDKMLQLASYLREISIQAGDRVGVYMNRSLESVIAVYGIMHAGGVFVPIDPAAPPSRVQFVLQDCQIKVLITNPAQKRFLASAIPESTSLDHLIGIDGSWHVPSISWDDLYSIPIKYEASPRILEEDLAYIMYTSGSTGAPKGIMHSHYSGLSYARLSAELYQIQPEDRIAGHAQLHFDMSTFGYFTSPLAGATTVIIPDAHTKMPASLADLIEKEKISIWYSVPLALSQLLQRGGLESKNLENLRWVLYGGEPFPPKILRQLMEAWPQARFCNVYGPAEVNQCTYYHIPPFPEPEKPIPLGHIWDNTQALVLDEKDQILGEGEIGELLIRSATQMIGYWNQPELTQEKFYNIERVPGNPETYYRTGDLVKWEADRLLYFMGRKDRQVKIRGYRVELSEVEVVLQKHEAIAEAAVCTQLVPNQEKQILAFVILKEGEAPSTEELLRYAQSQLPAYAVPSEIRRSQTFPRTSAGKINYRELEKAY